MGDILEVTNKGRDYSGNVFTDKDQSGDRTGCAVDLRPGAVTAGVGVR